MAKVELNPSFGGFRGRIGDLVFRKSSNGTMFVSQYSGKSTKEPTEAQKAHRLRFKQASAYAKAALADPDLCTHYQELAEEEGKTPYVLAVAAYMNGTACVLKGTFAEQTGSALEHNDQNSE